MTNSAGLRHIHFGWKVRDSTGDGWVINATSEYTLLCELLHNVLEQPDVCGSVNGSYYTTPG